MSDMSVREALADLQNIRQQVARGTLFRGFGPTVVAASGALAALTAALQVLAPETFHADATQFLLVWSTTALVAAGLIGTEMIARTRRHHGGLADAMLLNAVEHFLPAGAAGLILALTLWLYAPDTLWLLPGIWQMLVGVGVFAAVRFLPRSVTLVGAWYLLCGVVVLILGAEARALSPWAMGVPFAVGQVVLAVLLHRAEGALTETLDA